MKPDKILLDHGSGGKISHNLTMELILPIFGNDILDPLNDGAAVDAGGSRLAFSTDSYTVDPIFFPGGNIGELAVNGTVNDIAMCGGVPKYLSLGLILEEGLPMADLEAILRAARRAADEAGVTIVTGDTKVVPRGAADKIFINTAGFGPIPDGIVVGSTRARAGDRIVLSGTLADHGATIMTQRQGLTFDADVCSDSAPLNHMVQAVFAACSDVHVLRDPTRGGLGTALNEIAGQSGVGICIDEDRLPVRPAVAGICELLGFDPLYLANEGKMIAIVPAQRAEAVMAAMQQNRYGKDACIIGEVVADHPGRVVMATRIGGSRIVDMLAGEQLPRIC